MRDVNPLGLSLIAMLVTAPAVAQIPASMPDGAGQGLGQGEIIVTATKREQSLQDVPISVSVTDAEVVDRTHVRDLIDLQALVPSLIVAQFQNVGQTNFIIRGFGNGNGNDGIESSVGVFIDGVYRSRSSAALDDLPEIERIEVLRGPQSTLFGKNVSAGAINIVTRKPQFEWGGTAEISIGNYGLINPQASITGPLSKQIAFRIAGNVNERDGYFTNVTTAQDANNRNRRSLRADVLWQPVSDFSLRVIGDYSIIKERCCGAQTIFNGPATGAIAALGFQVSDPSRIFDRQLVYNSGVDNRVVNKGMSAQADLDLGFARLTSITAYRAQQNNATLDVDFTGADIASQAMRSSSRDITQEFRLASSGTRRLNWLVGGFYQDEHLNTGRDIRYGRHARSYINAITGNLITALESLQQAVGLPVVPNGTYFQPGQGISDFYTQRQQSYSLFGQADYKIADRLTLTGGFAYLNDYKVARSHVFLTDAFSALDLANAPGLAFVPTAVAAANPALAPLVGCLAAQGYAFGPTLPGNLFDASLGASLPFAGPSACQPGTGGPAAGANPFALDAAQFFYGNAAGHAPVNFPNSSESGVLNGDRVTYAARAAYDFGFLNAYISYSTGWKAGAFNLSSDSRPAQNGVGRSVAPEKVSVYEFGLKARFRNGYANLAIFKQAIRGFQSNPFNGTGYDLINAGKESVRGFEVDAAYRPLPWLALTGSATYLDPKYDSFGAAACVNYDPGNCTTDPVTRRSTRNLTGRRPAGIPTWTAATSATISHDFGDGVSGYLRGDYYYVANTQLSETTPPDLSTYGVNNVNASVGLTSTRSGLEAMIWVRNFTSNNYLVSTFPTAIQMGSYSGYPNQPRTYGMTLRQNF
ncbi:TonB-dependent receptor [Sphingomonas sp.]|uniref:TonB-dependent receptor n=1 Tax=Sphingomonas sp. TaxID=28214 RepID=UPI0025FD4B56|nr:TonB-dependent receptor [Sphingomonas sp.]